MIRKRIISVAVTTREAINEFLADNCTHLAAAISYYLLLSLFPLILAAISILGYVSRSPDVQAKITQGIADLFPVSGDFLAATVRGVAQGWGAAGAIATVGLFWSGMAVFNAIRKSLNTAWGIKQPRTFLRERLMEFLMMIGFGALFLISIGLTSAFKIIQGANIHIFGEGFLSGGLAWHTVVITTSVAVTFVGFLFLYKFVPNTRVRWKHVWVGALVAAVLFEIVKNVFVWFVGNFAAYNLVYGSMGTIIALMAWANISAVIVLFCAKLISVFTRVKPSPAEEALPELATQGKKLNEPLSSKSLLSPKKATGKQVDTAIPQSHSEDHEQSESMTPKIPSFEVDS